MAKPKASPNKPRVETGATRSHVEGKITVSSVTREMVEERAQELAAIAGREPDQVTDSDRRQAKRELQGKIHPPPRAFDDPEITHQEWESEAPSRGQRTRKHGPNDGQLPEDLVEEGLSNAEHDQMVAARKAGK
jgi:hypothetical protein